VWKDATLVSLPTDSRTRRIIDGAAATAGFTFRHAVTVNQFATLYSFVRNGVGLTIVPDRALPPAHDPELVSRPLVRPRVSREIGIVRLRGRDMTPAAAGLLTLLKERLRRPRRVWLDAVIRKSIYTKTGILLGINCSLRNYVSGRNLPDAIDERRRHSMFASLSAMIAVAAPNIRLPSYENPNRGSSGVKLWKAKNHVR
jgi:hypothetical protein